MTFTHKKFNNDDGTKIALFAPNLNIYFFGNPPNCFSNAANYCSQRIGIGSQEDGFTDGILEAGTLADNPQGYRYRTLACLVKTILHFPFVDMDVISG